MERVIKAFLVVVGTNLVILNGAVVYWYITKSKVSSVKEIETKVVQQDVCGINCQKFITDQLANYKLPTPLPTAKPKVVVVPTVAKTTTVSYVPVPGNGNTQANDWVDLPGTDFYFNVSSYSGLQSIYFETNIHLANGNGQAFVRLFDVTHGIGVQGSEVNTINQVSSAVASGQVSFYQGNNLYRVQAKSLTADTTIFDSGRLKITTKN